MGTNCVPLVADLFLLCYKRDFMMSLSDDKKADIIDAFNTTCSSYGSPGGTFLVITYDLFVITYYLLVFSY